MSNQNPTGISFYRAAFFLSGGAGQLSLWQPFPVRAASPAVICDAGNLPKPDYSGTVGGDSEKVLEILALALCGQFGKRTGEPGTG